LQGASEAQLSAWVQHLFQAYLGYTHWKEITREGASPIGSKGSKQLFPDLRINILDNGVIFIECKRPGRLDGPKGQEELKEAEYQLMSYIRAYVDQATIKPKTVLGVVTDGNHWNLTGLNKTNEFHTIDEWAFLTDDPRLIAQRLWLLAKPALAQPTSALVEFLARRTLAEVLKDHTKRLTKQVNENLPDGSVSEELIGKWLREALSDPVVPPRHDEPAAEAAGPASKPPALTESQLATSDEDDNSGSGLAEKAERYSMRKRFWAGLLSRPKVKTTRHANIAPGEYTYIGAGSGVRGLHFNYVVGQTEGRVELYIDRGAEEAEANKPIFDRLNNQKKQIEGDFGGELSWQRLDEQRSCRIACGTTGGWKNDESKWPEIQDAMIDAMIRLEKALKPHLASALDGE
jgi:Domain of unknown function (DUF4268)